VGAAVGGAAEIMTHNHNALTFAPGDAAQLADRLQQLAASPKLHRRLTVNARRTALEKYDIRPMAVGIENYLRRWVVN